tara:strand:- start:312 stop:545 length:234 start_codon:yes stop_codon:yes gene_type:complete
MTDNEFMLMIGGLTLVSYLFFNYTKSENPIIRFIRDTLLGSIEDGDFMGEIYKIIFFAGYWVLFYAIIKLYVIGFDE